MMLTRSLLKSILVRFFLTCGRFRSGVYVGVLVGLILVNPFTSVSVQAEFPALGLETVSSGELVSPIALTNAGDGSGRLFTVDQRGKIQIIQGGTLLGTPFLDIGSKLVPQRPGFDERGLLSLAFHPDYTSSGAGGEGKFYVYYSAPRPGGDPNDPVNPIDHQSVIAEYQISGNPNVANAGSERILLSFDQPQFNHDGGQLAFGADKMLYISTGDGGGGGDNEPGHTGGGAGNPSGGLGNAQDRTNLLGNILRIDPFGNNGVTGQYGIPGNNPFVGEGGGVREEIYAYGFRNPWRFSFDDGPGGTGEMFVADVGQGKFEEVNIVESEGNYGWRIREGLHDFDATVPDPGVSLIDPIAEYSHPGVGIGEEIGLTVIGGHVYRGSEISELIGKYIFGDWHDGTGGFSAPGNGSLLGLEETSEDVWELSVLQVDGGNPIGIFITAIGEDESGELYVVAKSALDPGLDPDTGLPGGVIFKIVPEPATLVDLDIKPGSDRNPVNLKSKGKLPVVVFGNEELDVSVIDLATLLLNGVGLTEKNNGSLFASLEDEDGDGILDLVMHFAMQDLDIEAGTDELLLSGNFLDGGAFEGSDIISIVGSGDANGDGIVSADDFASVQGNFGSMDDTGIFGDATGDGAVSADDYASVQSNFGATAGMGGVPVPEPATLSLLLLGGLALLRYRR